MTSAPETAPLLRRLWAQHRATPFPAAGTDDGRLQEVALYESWLGGVVEAALERDATLTPAHRALVEARRAEGNRALWAAAGEMGDPVRAYVARLIAIEDAVESLPDG